jgi:hypothetical protein
MIVLKKPERKLDFIFFSYHCKLSRKYYKGIKDLRLIYEKFMIPGYTKENTFIIDDLNKVKKINNEQCIAIKEFEFEYNNSDKDTGLLEVSTILEKM